MKLSRLRFEKVSFKSDSCIEIVDSLLYNKMEGHLHDQHIYCTIYNLYHLRLN